jgi:hypothetical protein
MGDRNFHLTTLLIEEVEEVRTIGDEVNCVGGRISPVPRRIPNTRYMFVRTLTVRLINARNEIFGHQTLLPWNPPE